MKNKMFSKEVQEAIDGYTEHIEFLITRLSYRVLTHPRQRALLTREAKREIRKAIEDRDKFISLVSQFKK